MILIYLLQPYFSAEYYKIEKKEETSYDRLYSYQNFALKYSLYIIVFALAFFLISFDDLVMIVGKAEYLQTKNAVYGFALLPVCMCLAYFFQILLVLAGKSKQLPFFYISCTVVVILLNFIFVPYFDYFASAVITSLSYFVLMIIFYKQCPKNLFHFRVKAFDVLFFMGSLVLFVALLVLSKMLPGLYLRFGVECVIIVLMICFIFFVNRKDFEFFKKENLT
jgi:O-antigen/teichoic acid export membrane protein